jgi:hypothetical protein
VTDVCLGVGDPIEGVGDDKDVLDIDHNDANAMGGVVHGVQAGDAGGALAEAKGDESGIEERVPLTGSLLEAVDVDEHTQDTGGAVGRAFGLTHEDIRLFQYHLVSVHTSGDHKGENSVRGAKFHDGGEGV